MNESAEEEGRNRRRHDRVDVPLLVQYRFGALDEPRFDYALNVSRSGIFINCSEEHETGTRVYVQLTTRDGAHFLQGEGTVVRRTEGGYAIDLDGFSAEDSAVLDKLVGKALAEADALAVGPSRVDEPE